MSTLSLSELIAQMTERLEAAGISLNDGLGQGTLTAFDEAVWLTLWKLNIALDSDLDELAAQPISSEQAQAVQDLISQRISTRQPAAYLTREAWLQGVPFYVDERVIIPRSFIAELLADESIDSWLSEDTQRVLDLCTGNGSLAVLAALTYPEVQVDAADISTDALAVARMNVDKHELQDRIALIESNGLAACAGPYDLILCNPPYVSAGRMAALPAEFKAEPALALAGGEDGMDFIRDLFRDAVQHMSENAVLVLEIGNEREHFERAFPALEPLWFDTSAGSDQLMLITRQQLLSWS